MDCFAALGERRRPWLDPEALKQKFLAQSALLHPDRVHTASEQQKQQAQQRFTELNHAYQKLRDSKERVQHLLELETGAPPAQVQRVPAELMDMAMTVGQACQQADAFLDEKARTTSPLLQVGLFERAQVWLEKLNALRTQLERKRESLDGELRTLDADWVAEALAQASSRANLLVRLENVYRLLSYYNRWRAQVQERITRLSF